MHHIQLLDTCVSSSGRSAWHLFVQWVSWFNLHIFCLWINDYLSVIKIILLFCKFSSIFKQRLSKTFIHHSIFRYYILMDCWVIIFSNAARTNRRDKRNRNVSWPHGIVLDCAHSPEISGRLVLYGLPATLSCCDNTTSIWNVGNKYFFQPERLGCIQIIYRMRIGS